MKMEHIKILDDFYLNHCNDEWEHKYGITIETCDNLGWQITVSHPTILKEEIRKTITDFVKEIDKEQKNQISFHDKDEYGFERCILFGPMLKDILNVLCAFLPKI